MYKLQLFFWTASDWSKLLKWFTVHTVRWKAHTDKQTLKYNKLHGMHYCLNYKRLCEIPQIKMCNPKTKQAILHELNKNKSHMPL